MIRGTTYKEDEMKECKCVKVYKQIVSVFILVGILGIGFMLGGSYVNADIYKSAKKINQISSLYQPVKVEKERRWLKIL